MNELHVVRVAELFKVAQKAALTSQMSMEEVTSILGRMVDVFEQKPADYGDCDQCAEPITNPDILKLSRIRFRARLCVSCYKIEKQAVHERAADTEQEERQLANLGQEIAVTMHQQQKSNKIVQLTAVLSAVLDWPVEEVRPFAEQIYHLANNPEVDPSTLELRDVSQAELLLAIHRSKLAALEAEQQAS